MTTLILNILDNVTKYSIYMIQINPPPPPQSILMYLSVQDPNCHLASI